MDSSVTQLVDTLKASIYFLSLFSVVVGAYLIRVRITEIPDDQIIEQWSCMLPGLPDKRKDYKQLVEQALEKNKLAHKRKNLSASGDPRANDHKYVLCKWDRNYSCYFGAVVVGPNLALSWSLRERNRYHWMDRIPLFGPALYRLFNYHRFTERNQARAFASVTHACAVEAAEKILEAANRDTAKLNRKTSGKLGPL